MSLTRLCVVVVLMIVAAGTDAQDWAKARLEKSPRHLEWIAVTHEDRQVECFIAYPEVSNRATTVVVIHEIFGLTDWVRSVCDQLAEAGYIAVAPDLLSGLGEGGGGTASFGSVDDVRTAIRSLPPQQITADLNAVVNYVRELPAGNGKIAVAGFCWGGAQTFHYATENPNIAAGFVFYGAGPKSPEAIARITAPIYGFYGENDARVNTTIPKSEALMKEAGKTYEPVIYEGAGHGFLRAGAAPDAGEANKRAHDQAWERLKKLLAGL